MYAVCHNITIRVLPMNAFFVITTGEFWEQSKLDSGGISCTRSHYYMLLFTRVLGRGWRRLDIDFCISLLSAVVA